MRKAALPAALLLGLVSCAASPPPAPSVVRAPASGVYLAFMAFAADAVDISRFNTSWGTVSDFIAPDASSPLVRVAEILRDGYTPTDTPGTALYYALRKALDNLAIADAEGVFPKKVDALYFLTVTDGYDTASAQFASRTPQFAPLPGVPSSPAENDYAAMLKRALQETTVGGARIRSYVFALGDAPIREQLEIIAGGAETVVRCPDRTTLETALAARIADIGRVSEEMTMAAAIAPPFDGTRLRFAAAADAYIDATFVFRSGSYTLENIESVPPDFYKAGSATIRRAGGVEKKSVTCEFTVHKYFSPNNRTGRVYRITERAGGVSLHPDTDAALGIYEKTAENRSSVIVYFILDNSASMAPLIPGLKNLITTGSAAFYGGGRGMEAVRDTFSPSATPVYLLPALAINAWRAFLADDRRKDVDAQAAPLLGTDPAILALPLPASTGTDTLRARYAAAGIRGDLNNYWVDIPLQKGRRTADFEVLASSLIRFGLPCTSLLSSGEPVLRFGPFRTAEDAKKLAAEVASSRP